MSEILNRRETSEFTFYQGQNNVPNQQQSSQNTKQPLIDNNFMFQIDAFEQQYSQIFNQQKMHHHSPQNKVYKQMKKEEVQKVFKYFRKYQPLYFNRVEIKELSYKFKKGVYIKKYKEGYYFGQLLSMNNNNSSNQTKNIKNGKGILIYGLFATKNDQNLKIYEGSWINDKKQGLGFQKFIDGSVYHGFYHQNKPSGKGKFTNAKGEIYEGQWINGVKKGKGFWKGINGQTYIGQWNDGNPQGYGVFVNPKGDRFQGQFKNSMKHGQGIEKFINGDIYKGFYQNDKPSGFGQYYWKNKSYFKGYFKNGLRCGQGLWKRNAGNSDKYEGQYQNDKKWGYGVFTWANGNYFKGNYSGDLRNGYGQMFWSEGSYYKGNWNDGVQHGKGQLFIAGEGLRIGIFQDNQLIELMYQEFSNDNQNEQNEQNNKLSKEKKKLFRNKSNQSNISLKSKNSKVSNFSKQKSLYSNKNNKTLLNKFSKLSLIDQRNTQKDKLRQDDQKKNGIRSVPLKSLFQQKVQGSRVFQKNDSRFRISKVRKNDKMNESLDSNNFSIKQKRKNRILHSSFYLHKFKNIGRPVESPSQNKRFFNQTQQ